MADMAMDEGTTRFARRGPRSGGEVCGGGGRKRQGKAEKNHPSSQTEGFDVQRGRGQTRSHARAEGKQVAG
jgi:hypothetical protein